MQIISKNECISLIQSKRPYSKISIIQDYNKEERDISQVLGCIENSSFIYTDASTTDTYITMDIHFKEEGKDKIARVLLI